MEFAAAAISVLLCCRPDDTWAPPLKPRYRRWAKRLVAKQARRGAIEK